MKIAFIGLGNMGHGMASNLAKAGHQVLGFDLSDAHPEGVTLVSSARAAAQDAQVVITMLPHGAALGSVMQDISDVLTADQLLVDCSTVDVESARAAHDLAAAKGAMSLDAPVSGGSAGAIAGTLTFMVGGSAQSFDQAQPLFAVMGQKAVHCGDAGAGQIAKLCNNMLLGISMIATSEAFAMGQKLGLDPQRLFDVISTSSGSCWSVNTYCPLPGVGPDSPADHDYAPGFAADLMLKDLRLAQGAAELADASTPFGTAASEIYSDFVANDGPGKDFSAIYQRLMNAARDPKA